MFRQSHITVCFDSQNYVAINKATLRYTVAHGKDSANRFDRNVLTVLSTSCCMQDQVGCHVFFFLVIHITA